MNHSTYLKIAETIGQESYCVRKKVGALIVSGDGKNMLSYGYNGTVSGFPNVCELPNGETDPAVIHAEINAIAKLAKSTQSSEGAILYTTLSPCLECAKAIVQSGINEVVYSREYKDLSGIDLLNRAKVKTIFINNL